MTKLALLDRSLNLTNFCIKGTLTPFIVKVPTRWRLWFIYQWRATLVANAAIMTSSCALQSLEFRHRLNQLFSRVYTSLP